MPKHTPKQNPKVRIQNNVIKNHILFRLHRSKNQLLTILLHNPKINVDHHIKWLCRSNIKLSDINLVNKELHRENHQYRNIPPKSYLQPKRS